MAKHKSEADQEQDITLARIDEKLKGMIATQELIYAEVKKTNGRVTVLENWKSKLNGSYIAIVAVCSVFAFIIGITVTYFLK